MKALERITLNPAVMGGRPCIRGLRVTVGTVVGLVAAGRTPVEILKLYNDRYIVGDVLKITKSDLFIKMDPRFIDRQQDPSTCANLHDSIALGEAESYTCHSEWLRQRHREFHVRTKRSTVVGAVILSRNEKPASATLHPNGKPICAAQPTRP